MIDHRFVISWELTAYNTVTQAEYGTELCFELMKLVQFLSGPWEEVVVDTTMSWQLIGGG